MKKLYRNQQQDKLKPKTKAQRRREWEYTVIAGGMIRASAFPRTAMMLNKGRGAMVRVIAVPLYADRHIEYLDQMAEWGIMGQTAEEVAASMIMDAIIKGITDGTIKKISESMRIAKEINLSKDAK